MSELSQNITRNGELLPCPFCGGEAHVYKNNLWHVACERAHNSCVTMSAFVTEAEAVAAWNTRAERTCESTTDGNAWCFVCSECGKSFPRNKLHLAHNHGEINYCPNCGAKVVSE